MFGLRGGEIILIVLAIFLLFGATRLPQLARSLGQSRKAFKDAIRSDDDDDVEPQPRRKAKLQASEPSYDELQAELTRRKAAREASK